MQMRYRYRIEPTDAQQQQQLARVFGCVRVVFNDALRVRDEAYRAGMNLSDIEIQRRVITQAKTTVERAWLAEVPSVALVQSVNDARRTVTDSGREHGRAVCPYPPGTGQAKAIHFSEDLAGEFWQRLQRGVRRRVQLNGKSVT